MDDDFKPIEFTGLRNARFETKNGTTYSIGHDDILYRNNRPVGTLIAIAGLSEEHVLEAREYEQQHTTEGMANLYQMMNDHGQPPGENMWLVLRYRINQTMRQKVTNRVIKIIHNSV